MGIGAALAASAAASIGSGLIGASAAKSAAKTQQTAAEEALTQQQATTEKVLGLEQPFVDVGKAAIPQLENLLGIGPGGQAGIQSALAATPGYQFTLTQGLQAAQSGFASQGLARSGPAIKGAVQYAEGLAGTTYEQRLQDYYNTVAGGSTAASNFGAAALGGQAAANQLTVGAGQAGAAGTVGAANALTGGLSGATNTLLPLSLANQGLFGTGGTTGVSSSLNAAALSANNALAVSALPYSAGMPFTGG